MLYTTNKKEVHHHPQVLLDGFITVIEDSDLPEVDLSGGSFTWDKSIGKEYWVKEMLDRAFSTVSW